MEVYASFKQKVQVNPKEVVQQLMDNEIGWRGWVVERDGNYYRGEEVSAGSHSFDKEIKISKSTFEYIQALGLILQTLEKKEK